MSNVPAKAVSPSPDKLNDKTPEKKKESSPHFASPTPTTAAAVEEPLNRLLVRGENDDDDRIRVSKRKRSPNPQQDHVKLSSASPSPKKPRNIKDRGRGGRRGGYGPRHQPYSGGRHTYTYEVPYASPWYQNDFQDWETVSGGGNRADAGEECDGLMSFRQFTLNLDEEDIEPSEAEKRYNEYKHKYVTEQKKSFFELNKEEEWLKDIYHPANLQDIIERRNYLARNAAHNLLTALQFDTLILVPSAHACIKNIGPWKISVPDVRGFYFNKPAPQAHPVSSDPRRVLIDTNQAQALLKKLDSEKGIVKENLLARPWEGDRIGSSDPVIILKWPFNPDRYLKDTQLLDTLITYLWNIHGLDYYGMLEKTEPKGLRHVRCEASDVTSSSSNGAEWEKKLDFHWRKRLDSHDHLELMAGEEKIDAAVDHQALDTFIRKIEDEEYDTEFSCGVEGCTSFFVDTKFALMHLNHKHPELVMELTSKIQEDRYLENYMSDVNAPGSKVVMQKTVQIMTIEYYCSTVERRQLRSYVDLDDTEEAAT